MRKRKYSTVKRWWEDFETNSLVFYLLLPFTGTVFVVKAALCVALALVVYAEITLLPSALRQVERAFREAEALGQTDDDSTRLKGGEARQKGSERKGSLVRPGGPLSSDDLRRRLYELRERKPKGKANLARNVGGQNGE